MPKNSIQFFGLPGSGKTFTLKSLLKAFPEHYKSVPNFSKLKRFWLFMLFVIRFPLISAKFFSLLFRNNFKLWKYIFHLVSVSFASQMYVLLQKEDGRRFLIDEGVYQRLLSVTPRRFSEKDSIKLVKYLNNLNSKVVVTSGGDFGRFLLEPDRMISHRNKLGDNYFKKWSEDLVFNFQSLSGALSSDNFIYERGKLEELHAKIQS